MTLPAVGTSFRLRHDVNMGHLSIFVPSGSVGTVTYSEEGNIVALRMDDPIPNLVDSEWENELIFAECDDPGCFTNTCEPV